MLKPVDMAKISIIGPRDYLPMVSELLHEKNAVHISSPEEEEYFKIGEPLKKASEVSRNLVRLRSYLAHLNIDSEKIFPTRKYKTEELEKELQDKMDYFEKEIGEKIERQREITERKKLIEDEKKIIEPLKTLGIPPKLLKGYKNISCFVGFYKADPSDRIREVTSDFEVVLKDYRKELVGAVFVRSEYREEVFTILQEFGFSEISVPDIEDYDARVSELDREKAALEEENATLDSQTKEVKEKETEFMLAMEEYMSIELDKYELPLSALESKYAFFMVGFVPEKDFDDIKSEIESKTEGRVSIERTEIEEEPPTLLKNPPGAKNFESLTHMFSTPKSFEVDPTLIMAFAFPIFFGMMLGDIGYGLLITVLALYLKRIMKTEGWQRLLNMSVMSGLVAILFGFIYGEFFGPFIVPGYEPPDIHVLGEVMGSLYAFHHGHPVFDRVEEMGVKVLLFTTLVIGMIKVLGGFAIGFSNVLSHHGIKAAILEKASWFIGVLAMSFLILGFSWNAEVFFQLGVGPNPGHVPPLPLPGLVPGWQAGVNIFYKLSVPLIVVWLVLFLMEEIPAMGPPGVVMAVEILTWFGHILSYARLLAIGLSSVYIAFVINYVVPLLMNKFIPIPIVAGIIAGLIMILAHLFNLILGILDPGLQSLRLHYVEFFPKFLEGGGRIYEPFGKVKRFIE